MGENDAEDVRAAQQGDVEAFSRLVERHWIRLVAFARSVIGDAEAEDAVQEGLVRAWDKLEGLREPQAFLWWVLRIVSRTCIRQAKRTRHLVPLSSVTEPADPAANQAQGEISVERVLSALPPRQRAVMHLTVIEGMSDSEIGSAMGITAGSVRAHRRRARDRLRAILQTAQVAGR